MNSHEILQNVFGFSSFRAGQEQVIDSILGGKSALAVFPTGSGKSLCYQLPGIMLPGLTVVISPLIALMKDQVEFLRSKSVNAARLDSSLSLEEVREVHRDLYNGSLKFLYISPERMSNERFLETLKSITIDLMVIDEAHCISEWGHNFRPEYLKLAELAKKLDAKRVLTLTATATPDVVVDICRAFNIENDSCVCTGFYRPNLSLLFTPCSDAEKDELLFNQISSKQPGATIIYVTLQKTAFSVAEALKARGLDARAYHAGMSSEDRNETQDWFMASNSGIVVATIAFGMGIDKSDIRYVYHYNLPKSIENYSQEVGRAGRDGNPSDCEVLATADDMTVLENFIYGDTPTEQGVYSFLEHILNQPEEFSISVYEISNNYDIRPLVVNTLFTYLQLEGVVASTAPFYKQYKYQFLVEEESVISMFDQNRQIFLRNVFSCAKKGRTWFTLDIDTTVNQLGEPRQRIVKALNYLEEKGLVKLNVSGIRQGYRVLNRVELDPLYSRIVAKISQNEERNISRSQKITDLINHQGCKVSFLLNYFGENLNRECGHCEWCMKGSGGFIERQFSAISEFQMSLISKVIQAGYFELGTPRQLARFLCGITSPATTRAKLNKSDEFGLLSNTPFNEVIDSVSQFAY